MSLCPKEERGNKRAKKTNGNYQNSRYDQRN